MAASNTPVSFYTASLIVKHLRGELTIAEQKDLKAWLAAGEQNRKLFRELTDADEVEKQLQLFNDVNAEAAWQRLQHTIKANAVAQKKQSKQRLWWQAAAAIFILAITSLLILQNNANKPVATSLVSKYGGDVLPGMRKARLVLSNGKSVLLNNGTDSVFEDNGHTIHAGNGSIAYGQATAKASRGYNTLYIPRGGEYMMVLSDGTKVWLNAASMLRYPVQFNGKERKVELMAGEAYFEVAKNNEKPFMVVTGRMEIQDIGTTFNVNSYANADDFTTATLTEGIIQVTALHKTVMLRPGEQVQANDFTSRLSKADTAMAVAWKNGLFMFNNTPLEQVAGQIERWYNVSIVFDKDFTEKKFFTGEINRTLPLSKILEMMELTGIARFSIMNHTVVIKPYTEKQD